jgi:SAM-dependent methyltransferase
VPANHIERYYQLHNEQARFADNAHRLEWLTTIGILDRHIRSGARIFDIGAGTGAYALHYARRNHAVTALDLLPAHVAMLSQCAAAEGLSAVTAAVGDARDLSAFSDSAFDVVLCMGPLYHLSEKEDRRRSVAEALRVLIAGGVLALTYVSTNARESVTQRDTELRRLRSLAFVLDEPREFVAFVAGFPVNILDHVATNSLADRREREILNRMSPDEFAEWADHHLETCREPRAFARTYHGLVLCTKGGRRPMTQQIDRRGRRRIGC